MMFNCMEREEVGEKQTLHQRFGTRVERTRADASKRRHVLRYKQARYSDENSTFGESGRCFVGKGQEIRQGENYERVCDLGGKR